MKLTKTIMTAALCLTCTATAHAYSLLRATVIEFYGASHAAQDAIAFDVCATPDGQVGGARDAWLTQRQKRVYDRVMVKLTKAYLADPRDAAVEQVHKDFCDAVKHRRSVEVRYE